MLHPARLSFVHHHHHVVLTVQCEHDSEMPPRTDHTEPLNIMKQQPLPAEYHLDSNALIADYLTSHTAQRYAACQQHESVRPICSSRLDLDIDNNIDTDTDSCGGGILAHTITENENFVKLQKERIRKASTCQSLSDPAISRRQWGAATETGPFSWKR